MNQSTGGGTLINGLVVVDDGYGGAGARRDDGLKKLASERLWRNLERRICRAFHGSLELRLKSLNFLLVSAGMKSGVAVA
jgi:hypothetical protein